MSAAVAAMPPPTACITSDIKSWRIKKWAAWKKIFKKKLAAKETYTCAKNDAVYKKRVNILSDNIIIM